MRFFTIAVILLSIFSCSKQSPKSDLEINDLNPAAQLVVQEELQTIKENIEPTYQIDSTELATLEEEKILTAEEQKALTELSE